MDDLVISRSPEQRDHKRVLILENSKFTLTKILKSLAPYQSKRLIRVEYFPRLKVFFYIFNRYDGRGRTQKTHGAQCFRNCKKAVSSEKVGRANC